MTSPAEHASNDARVPQAPVRQAVILTGGKATRLRPYTDDRPKPMVEIAGKPIIFRQLEWLQASGVTHVVVSCGYKAEVLREALTPETFPDLKIRFALEEEPLGRGGGLKFAAAELFFLEPWYGLNGDVLTDLPLKDFSTQHVTSQNVATLALAPLRTSWGVVDVDDGQVTGFRQSPVLPYWLNAGVYCFDFEMRDELPDKGDHEDSTFPKLAEAGRLGAYFIQGYWRGIDNAKDVAEATAELS